jgi:hypothetical protein
VLGGVAEQRLLQEGVCPGVQRLVGTLEPHPRRT